VRDKKANTPSAEAKESFLKREVLKDWFLFQELSGKNE